MNNFASGMMKTPVTALIWESWRRIYLQLAIQLIVTIGFGVLFLNLMPADIELVSKSDFGVGIALISVFFLIVCSPATARKQTGYAGFTYQMAYSKPVSTLQLVAAPLIFLLCISLLAFLIPVMIFKLTFGIQPNLIAIGLLIVGGFSIYTALNWWTASSLRAFITVAVVILVATIWMRSQRQQNGADFPPVSWSTAFEFTSVGWMLFILAISLSLVAILSGVTKQRYGEELLSDRKGLPDSGAHLTSFVRRLSPACPTSSQFSAELWKSLHSRILSGILRGIGFAAWTIWMLVSMSEGRTTSTDDVLSMPIVMFLGMLVGVVRPTFTNGYRMFGTSAKDGIDTFSKTVVMDTTKLSQIRVLASVIVTFVALTVFIAALTAAWPFFFDNFGGITWNSVAAIGNIQPFLLLGWILVGLCLFVSFLVCFAALAAAYIVKTARMALVTLVVVITCVVPVLLSTDTTDFRSQVLEGILFQFWIGLGLLIFSIITMFRSTLSDNILTAKSVQIILALWLLFTALYCVLLLDAGVFQSEALAPALGLIIAIGILPLFATVVAPWLMARLRHN